MEGRGVSTLKANVVLWSNRNVPGRAIMEDARALESSGVVDGFTCLNHMVSFMPPCLWRPENTPLAAIFTDMDCLHDAHAAVTLGNAAAPGLEAYIASDPVRTGPANLVQTMWSLAHLSEGKIKFHFGPGEVKNLAPFGFDRRQGLKRFEDMLRVADLMLKSDGPVDFTGHYTTLKNAFLGGQKLYRPEIWSMGTGPRQMDLATTYCDGVAAIAPSVWITPEHCRQETTKIRSTLASKGRDPGSFGLGVYCFNLLHEDPDVIDQMLDSTIIRWLTVLIGRINPVIWRMEDIEPPTPEGWTFFGNYDSYGIEPEFVDAAIAKTTRTMAERSFQFGTPTQVAESLSHYVDAGVNWMCFFDFAPLVLRPEDAAKSLQRQIELCARLKELVGSAIPLA